MSNTIGNALASELDFDPLLLCLASSTTCIVPSTSASGLLGFDHAFGGILADDSSASVSPVLDSCPALSAASTNPTVSPATTLHGTFDVVNSIAGDNSQSVDHGHKSNIVDAQSDFTLAFDEWLSDESLMTTTLQQSCESLLCIDQVGS